MDNLKIRTFPRAMVLGLSAAALLGAAFGCSSQQSARVPTRAPLGAPLLAGAAMHDAGAGRRDAMLGESREALVRVDEEVVVTTTDRRREYQGVPYGSYRSTAVTRERLVR